MSTMTIRATKFTPEVMLSAPRRSAAVPSPDGISAVYTVSTYSFHTHSKSEEVRILNIAGGTSSVLFKDASLSDPVWISNSELLMVKAGENGGSSLVVVDVNAASSTAVHSFPTSISNLKAKRISDHEIAIACSASATPDGSMVKPSSGKPPLSSAKVYSSLYVRHWDTWATANRDAIWYGLVKQTEDGYRLQEPGLVNALAGTKLESPVPPFGGAHDFDISRDALVFVARDPELNPALYTKSDLYYLPLESFCDPDPPEPRIIETPGLEGYSSSPVFSNDGKSVAFARMRHRQYEADKSRLLLVPILGDRPGEVQEFFQSDDGEGAWDLKVETILWSSDDKILYVTAEYQGHVVLYKTPSSPDRATGLPEAIFEEGSVADMQLLATDSFSLLLSTSSRIESMGFITLDPISKKTSLVSSALRQGRSVGLSPSQCSDFWFKGADKRLVQALVMYPSNFDKSKKYPLAFLVHGGPQGAWLDSWSTRWNPAVFAEQGYLVVAPNPTGSTGYGQEFTDRIQNEWGGRPYEDLERCWEYVRDYLPNADVENGVALGASYGGYMMNWIQGHPLGRKFKAIVCHDGVFSTVNQWSTEELFFPLHEFGGPLWERREVYEKWDPSKFTSEWDTPMLIIHNELDYRLPISEGLAMFNVLQTKNIPSRFVMFPDENHWVIKPENSLVWHREVLAWINKYSGIAAQAAGPHTERVVIA